MDADASLFHAFTWTFFFGSRHLATQQFVAKYSLICKTDKKIHFFKKRKKHFMDTLWFSLMQRLFRKTKIFFYIILRFCCVIINLQVCYQTNIGFLEILHMNTIYELNIGFYLYLYFAKKLTTLENLPHPEIYYPIEKQNYTHV